MSDTKLDHFGHISNSYCKLQYASKVYEHLRVFRRALWESGPCTTQFIIQRNQLIRGDFQMEVVI